MIVTPRLLACLLLVFCLCAPATAQTPTSQALPTKAKSTALTIAVATTEHGVRFTAVLEIATDGGFSDIRFYLLVF